jgi:orotate phosphoribosyltransferase
MMEGLFTRGRFKLHSGQVSDFKIDCDQLSHWDIQSMAYKLWERLPPFRQAVGIPEGGVRLAEALNWFATEDEDDPLLICDDVLTTGGSFLEFAEKLGIPDPGGVCIGAVLFARQLPEKWIVPLFVMTNEKGGVSRD